MATENQLSTATQSAGKKENPFAPRSGFIKKSNDGGIATCHPFGLLGIPLTPYDMLRMTPFSLFRRITEEL